jgi:hypothetical protein
MDADQDLSQLCIEDTLLLRFLITRYDEILLSDEPKLDPVWAALGLAALHKNGEWRSALEVMAFSDSYTTREVLEASIDIFAAELFRLQDVNTYYDCPEKPKNGQVRSRNRRKLLFWSWREGRKMGTKRYFEYYPIWELVSWLALYDEYLKEFEKKCRFSSFPPEEKLEEGLQIVKAAIFRRKIDNNSFLQDMLKTGTT